MPEGWRWVRLGDVTKVVGGSTPKTGIKEYWNGDIVWITPADLGKLSTREIYSSGRKITQLGYESSGAELVPVKTVVMSSRAPIGHLGIAAVPLCTNQGCKSFIPSESIDSVYLYFVLKQAVPELQLLGRGATFLEISKTQLENYFIPLPPLETQRRIAAILTEQMEAVEKARKAAEEGLEAARKLTAAHLRAVFESEEAATWKIVTIEEIADTCSGSTPLRSRKDYYNGNIPWVKTGELRDGLIENTEEHVSAVAIAETSLRLLPVNTLLIAMYGQGQTRGRTGLLAVPATTNQACFAILPNPQRFNPAFLQYWFRFSYSRLRSVSEGRGGNQPNLNGEILKAERVPLPTLETQHRIVAELNAKLEATQALIRSLEAQLEAIRALPAAILRRAFSGEL
ncbi:restriction endonuclease subunit S [Meiothermus taiwanensis]|uniref:restriction endonuclease subunit S n=1 Tax=Meiothermus taiwanensis TaxID=172827 RepID=UPI001CBE7D13|nr:restriction endonuclease subunit S [Meiothermus taiwanensis]